MSSHSAQHDSTPLMQQIAAMAGMPEALCKRMVLVLDVDDVPKLYVETYMNKDACESLALSPIEITVHPLLPDTLSDVLPDISVLGEGE